MISKGTANVTEQTMFHVHMCRQRNELGGLTVILQDAQARSS